MKAASGSRGLHRLFASGLVLFLFATVLAACGGSAEALSLARRTPLPALSDGRWAGTLNWTGTQRGMLAGSPLQIRDAPFSGSGSMQFVVQGDQIRESNFSMVISGTIDAVVSDAYSQRGERTMTYSGTVAGFPEGPCLEGQYDIAGTVVGDTPYGEVTVSLDPGSLVLPVTCENMPLNLLRVTCDVATGTFAPYFNEENARYGLSLRQQATFVMFRTGDYFTPAEAEANALQVQEWVTRLNSEVPNDPRAVRQLLRELERFFGRTFRNERCGRLGNGAAILADAVRVMTLGFLVNTPEIDFGDLDALTRANYRVGNFSFERDSDPLAQRVRAELIAALDDLVDRAERDGNSDLLESLEETARNYGWDQVGDHARNAWGRLNGG